MKKLLCSVLLLSVLFCFVACQQAPESSIVQPRVTERLITIATQAPVLTVGETKASSAETIGSMSPLYRRLGAPQAYEAALESRSEKLNITVDAAVHLPNVNGVPIARVQPAQFSQAQVTTFFNLLCGDTPMYDINKGGMTRADLKQNIKIHQALVAQDSSDEDAKASLANLEELLAAEPDDMEGTRSSGQLREMIIYYDEPDIGQYMGLIAVDFPMNDSNSRTYFSVQNDYDVMDWELFLGGKEIGAYMGYSNPNNGPDSVGGGYEPIYSPIADESIVPEYAKDHLFTTPAQARAQIEALLAQSGCGFVTDTIYLDEKVWMGVSEGTRRDLTYVITCGPKINDVMVRPVMEAMVNNYNTFENPNPGWLYEHMEWRVTDKGISSFSWRAPTEVTQIITEDAALLPFADIMEICKSMLPVVHENEITGYLGLTKREISIDCIALELQRVTEPDAIDEGLVIPVWNFYGDCTDEYIDAWHEAMDKPPKSQLTINAIDGSIINAHRGY